MLRTCSLLTLLAATPSLAADITYERLLNPEPQNWLTSHHSFNAARYSPLDIINRGNAKNLKLDEICKLDARILYRSIATSWVTAGASPRNP